MFSLENFKSNCDNHNHIPDGPKLVYGTMIADLCISLPCICFASVYFNALPAVIFTALGIICYLTALKTTLRTLPGLLLIASRTCLSIITLFTWGCSEEIFAAIFIPNWFCDGFAIMFMIESAREGSHERPYTRV